VLTELAASLISFQLGGDSLSVKLATVREPLLTNGQFKGDTKVIEWKDRGLPRNDSPPRVVYAIWTEPDPAEQQKRFGKVIFEGDLLVRYCAWYHGLTEAERKQWDEFVGTLSPGPKLRGSLSQFRFAGEDVSLAYDRRLAHMPVDALFDGLDP
jgi:hypothetical protein